MKQNDAAARATELLYAEEPFQLEGEPSLVCAFAFAATLLVDSEHFFVTEGGRLKWKFESLARYFGFDPRVMANVRKCLVNARMYDERYHELRGTCGGLTRVLQRQHSHHLVSLRETLATCVKERKPDIYYPIVSLAPRLKQADKDVFHQSLLLPLDNRRLLAGAVSGKMQLPSEFQKELRKTIGRWSPPRRQQLVMLLV